MSVSMLRASLRKSVGLLLISASLLPLATVTHAETAADAAEAAASDASDGGAEITVVARKRSENAQTVPIPITVISAEELTRQNLVNFTNFQNKFPSFSVYLTNPKQLNLGIRGIGNNGFNTDGIDGSVGIFVDGVYTGRQGMVSTDFNDVADVELLRGPQGTLFGKNTTAGAVIINTLKPEFGLQGGGEVSFGNFGLREVKASVTGPLIADKLAVRVSAFDSSRDGTYKNLYNGGDQNARQGSGIRAQLLATPTDNLTVRLIGMHGEQDFNTMSPVILSVYNPAALQARMAAAGYTLLTSNAKDRYVNIDGALNAQTKSNSASGEINFDVDGVGTFTSITAYQEWECFTNNDNDYTQLDAITDYGSCNKEHQFSQELRWSTPADQPIEATVGGFLSRQRLQVDSRIEFGPQYNIWAANPSATAFPTVGGRTWAQGAYAARLDGFGIASQAVFHTDTEALFGNVTWHPDAARNLSIDVGLRQTWERRSQLYDGQVVSNPGNLNTAQINAMSAAGANAQLGHVDTSLKDSALSGEAGINYKVTPDFFVYAKYARGNKSAGFNLLPLVDPQAIAVGAKQTVDGETADNFEVGFKSTFFDNKVMLNLTAFHTKVKDYQANQAIGVGNTALKFLSNVGSVTSKGIEAEMQTWLARGLHTKGFVAYNKATYSSFHNSVCPAQSTALTCDLTGRQVAWAPKWTADFTVDYTVPINDTTQVYGLFDVNYRSKQNTTITLDPSAEIKGYALASVRAGTLLDNGRLDVQLWVENLFDKAYYINLLGYTKSTGIIQGYPGNPRTYGVTVRVKM
ncbi:TonB-dependent receptor [Novosphingobium sp. AP12]|uniref:TonB-dependent receptor n=1 Tax=Novosphingobium sp. AP12 TaxID=1144305 RepID=UPI000271FB24|nr:TonB-dependent receptor [Novosphingobium sp. AP12]EJL30942.1 outer membrane receptor protein [Novosphingobium sp. AP12]